MTTSMLRSLSITCLFMCLSASLAYAAPPQQGVTFRALAGAGAESGARRSGDDDGQVLKTSLFEPRLQTGVGFEVHPQNFFFSASYAPRLVFQDNNAQYEPQPMGETPPAAPINSNDSHYEHVVRGGVGYYVGNLGADVGLNATFSSQAGKVELLPYLNVVAGWEDLYYAVSINSSQNRNFAIGFDQGDWMLDLKMGHVFERTSIEYGLSLRGLDILGIGGLWEQLFFINETTKIGYGIQAMYNDGFDISIGLPGGSPAFEEVSSFNVSGNVMFLKMF